MNLHGETSTCKAFSWQVWGHITSISTPEQEENRPERNGLSVCR